MSASYPKSRLPGPAVRLFDLDYALDADETARRSAHDDETLTQAPEVEWTLTDVCRELQPRSK